jgi:hypothetical protein
VIVMCIVMGLYPKPFLSRIEPSVDRIVARLHSGAGARVASADVAR